MPKYAIISYISSKGTAMTGSFLFVKPSNPEGKHGDAYSGGSPRYQYDHASWEWMLERAIRRTLIPWALTKSHSRVLLYGHEDKYSMHRWGSYGEIYAASRLPSEYESISQGTDGKNTDADLSRDDRKTPLPESWNNDTGVPTYSSGTKVSYGISDLEETVANLPFSLEWLHPDWSTSAVNAWDITASTTETTKGSAPASTDGFNWTWETTVNHIPYTIPNDSPFKCLSHMRTDDPIVTVNITNDDNKAIKVETAPTPMSAPKTTDGSIRDYHGTQVRSAVDGAAYGAGWMLYEFCIMYKYGLDFSPGTSSVEYNRGDKTYESSDTLGCLLDIPDKDSGNILTEKDTYGAWAGFAHEVDWGGKQTWWHANDFPKGLNSVLSPKIKTHLKALCSKCQPVIPPAVPAFWDKFPDAGSLQWNYFLHSELLHCMYPQDWMKHLALACTPFDMSARLDAMTTTVHRVPAIFAKIRTVETTYRTSRHDSTDTYSDSPGLHSWSASTDLKEVTVEGTSTDPMFTSGKSVSTQGSSVSNSHGTRSSPLQTHSWSYKTKNTWETKFESISDFLVCLRSTTNTTLSTKTTIKTSYTEESSDYDPSSSESETSDGSLPDSYYPDPDDLLFPDWVLPWIETAELFVSIESSIIFRDAADFITSEYHYDTEEGADTDSYSGSGSGTRTHKAHRKIVSLGQMNTSTGRFPAIDAAKVLYEVDPDPTAGTHAVGPYKISDVTETETTDSNSNTTKRSVRVMKGNVSGTRYRSISYYVVVRWKFDRTDPETLETESPLADLYRKLADARKALSDKKRELSDAQAALESAKSYLDSAAYLLALAQERLVDPDSAEPALLAEAQADLDRANKALSEAQSNKSVAHSEYSAAEGDMQFAESSLQTAQAAYDAAVEAGEGIEEARAALESAYAAYYEAVEAYGEASSKLADAEADETVAQIAADAAKDYYDTLHDKIEEILQKDVDDAQAKVDEAASKVNELTEKVNNIEGAIPGLEDAVKAAEQAIRDAGGVVN